MQKNDTNVIEMVPADVEDSKMKELCASIEETDKKLEELNSFDKRMGEDALVQEQEWLSARMEEQRREEAIIREELIEKQKILEERRRERSESYSQNRQLQIYNQMHEEEQKEFVYSLHGISLDKEQGMREYKNALYQGAQIILFFADIIIGMIAVSLHGLTSPVCLACIALLAAQVTLLPREHKGKLGRNIYSYISMVLSFLPTPGMALVLISDQLGLFDFELVLLVSTIGSLFLCAFGALDYFMRNPYRDSWLPARAARAEVKTLKRAASRNVKKNQKERTRSISKLTRAKEKAEAEALRLSLKIEKEQERKAKITELRELNEANRAKRKELRLQKKTEIKTMIDSFINKKAN